MSINGTLILKSRSFLWYDMKSSNVSVGESEALLMLLFLFSSFLKAMIIFLEVHKNKVTIIIFITSSWKPRLRFSVLGAFSTLQIWSQATAMSMFYSRWDRKVQSREFCGWGAHVDACTNTRTHMHTCMHIRTHAWTHTHIRTHAHIPFTPFNLPELCCEDGREWRNMVGVCGHIPS